jgi:hypothetical protein
MEFVGLKEDLQPVWHSIPGMKYKNDNKTQEFVNSKRMDVCSPRHDSLRAEPLEAARTASVWIRKYFLVSKDNVAEYFNEIFETWMHNPCKNVRNIQ